MVSSLIVAVPALQPPTFHVFDPDELEDDPPVPQLVLTTPEPSEMYMRTVAVAGDQVAVTVDNSPTSMEPGSALTEPVVAGVVVTVGGVGVGRGTVIVTLSNSLPLLINLTVDDP